MTHSTRAVAFLLLTAGCTTTYSDGGEPLEPSPCPESFDPMPGELGRVQFAHDRGALICIFGCGLGEPLAEAAVSRIAVYADEPLPPITVASDAPGVAEFAIVDDRIEVTTHAPGTARLELRDEAGALVDAVAVVVKPVTSIETREDLVVMVGGSTYVGVELKDELGCPVLGVGGVAYELSGGISAQQATLVDAITDFLFGFLDSSADEGFSLDAVSVGAGSLRITAPSGATRDLPVAVVGPESVATITLSPPGEPFERGDSQPITAAAFTADDRVIDSPACAWSLTATSGAPTITSEGRDSVYVMAPSTASATITCAIGAAAGSLDAVWP